jgi:hypothetical protein
MVSVQVIYFVAVVGKRGRRGSLWGKEEGGVPYGDKGQGGKGNFGFFPFPFNL